MRKVLLWLYEKVIILSGFNCGVVLVNQLIEYAMEQNTL